jgi:hypothetical protein
MFKLVNRYDTKRPGNRSKITRLFVYTFFGEDSSARFDVVNAVVEKQARKRPGRAAYIDTYRLFAGDDGGYTQYLPNGSGQLEKVRAGDGVHFERAGGDMIARIVLKELNKVFDLTSWRKKQTA